MFFEQLKYDRVNIINYKFIEEDLKKYSLIFFK